MAIKYVIIPEKKTVKAFLENTEYDACNKIRKMLHDTPFCACSEKYLMPDKFVAVVTCDDNDEFDVSFGMKRARKIVLDNYGKSMNKRMAKFRKDVAYFNKKISENNA